MFNILAIKGYSKRVQVLWIGEPNVRTDFVEKAEKDILHNTLVANM